MSGRPAASGPVGTVRTALAVLRRRWRPAYLAALVAAGVNTVPDVVRQLLVRDDPRTAAALLVDVLGFATGLVAQLWVTGAVAALPAGGAPASGGALRRGAGLAWRAVRTAPGPVALGVVLGVDGVLGPLDSPSAGAFAVATASDLVASVVTLPFLALVLVVAARSRSVAPPAGQ